MNTRAYFSIVVVFVLLVTACGARAVATNEAVFVWLEGEVMIARAGSQTFVPARTNDILKIGDIIRTGDDGRATIALWDKCMLRVLNNGRQVIQDGHAGKPAVQNKGGSIYLFIRELFGQTPARSQIATGATRGTELHLFVDPADDRSVFTVIDGEVDVTNEFGAVTLTRGQQTEIKPGEKPQPPSAIETTRIIQWCLYYPAVLDVAELNFAVEEKQRLAESLTAYAQGDLSRARQTLRVVPVPSEAERTYAAALWLAFADVPRAEALLAGISSPQAAALRRLITVVQDRASTNATAPATASGWMAESYELQARSKLPEALAAARAAARLSPQFGFAHARVAELEFSFAHRAEAGAALDQALRLSPRHGAAWVLRGFVHAAGNDHRAALADFEHAVSLDGTLPTAWLGRGLIKIRLGRSEEGRRDLQVAAVLQPSQSIFRSYLGKAWAEVGETKLAEKDFALARRLDTNDPTPLLYSALLKQSENRINEAVRDLERSVEQNKNRSVYRSAQLLDQDRAVRSANLASIYLDAGMIDVSVREAVRAVNYDYANYSAHLFLANSYDRLRDPKQINLRYETPWFSEYLIANLLAPVGAGTLSQNVSQQEYSKLFERDGFGVVNSTEYTDNGDWVQNATTHGRFRNTAYAVDLSYSSYNGARPNNEFEQTTVSIQLKQQLTPDDSVYLQVIAYDAEAGDVAQYYSRAQATRARSTETQEPILIAGYHHEWAPGVHTLLLASRADDTLNYRDPNGQFFFVTKNEGGTPSTADALLGMTNRYRSQLEIYSVELQQIFQTPKHTTIVGARYQSGHFDTRSRQSLSDRSNQRKVFSPVNPVAVDDINPGFERVSVYGYHHWQLHPTLLAVGGLSYDHLEFPVNYRFAPLSRGEERNDQVSPKGGLIWTPLRGSTVRAGYTRSLGGVSFDQSFRLEPTQIAGFNQAFRSLIPESIAAANASADFETYGISLEQKFPTATYVGLSLESLNSRVRRTVGVFETVGPPPARAGRTRERLDFEERSLVFTVNQLLGDEWALGARYQLSHARLDDDYTDLPAGTPSAEDISGFRARSSSAALLHDLTIFAIYNHPSGFFARGESLWRSQDNGRDAAALADDDVWQFNVFAGWRFWRRHAEVQVGLLNVTDQGYRLYPLNLYSETPRERTFAARLQFNF